MTDALAVIRALHRQRSPSAVAEGEGDAATLLASPLAAKNVSLLNTLPNASTVTDIPPAPRGDSAPEEAATLDEALTAIAWEEAYNRDESPELYTDLEEDHEVVLDDDLLADVALANKK